MLLILKNPDLVLFLDQNIIVFLVLGEVAITLNLSFFDQLTKHKDRRYLILLDHSPEVVDGYGEGTLSSYSFFLFYGYHVGVDVVLDCVLVT